MFNKNFCKIICIIFNLIIYIKCDKINECSRNCKDFSNPKKCVYEFNVSRLNSLNIDCKNNGIENCSDKWFGINGQSPGPSIEICFGDSLEIIVNNKLKSEEISFHWHGINQNGFAHMDGVSMITQCPILPFSSYRYKIYPQNAGTFYYHTHSVLQEGDGLYGALIVRGHEETLSLEKTIIISSRSSSPLSLIAQAVPPTPIALTINGEIKNFEIEVKKDEKYLLRLINANVFNCPIVFSIVKHNFEIIGADGHSIDPIKSANKVIIFPGERIDLNINTNMSSGKYKIYLEGINECKNLINEALLIYDDIKNEAIIHDDDNYHIKIPEVFLGHNCNELGDDVVCSLDLKNINNNIADENDDVDDDVYGTYYVPFDVNSYDHIDDKMTDYSFNIYEFSYYPSYLTTFYETAKIPQVNHVTFKYPPSPVLSQNQAISNDIFCSFDTKARSCEFNDDFCECLQILEVPENKIIDVVLINEGFGSNTSFVFHLHGYSANVLAVGSFDKPIKKNEIIELDRMGKLKKNNVDRLMKDTFVVPNKGYLILRLSTNNIGYWLWESRTTGTTPDKSGPVMEFLMRVGSLEKLPIVPNDFPTCGNHKDKALIGHS
ncbi:laccase-14-like isoform X2 [Aphidius gifuensis]|uniref:laccase-14-like isoform X2 n=1 Tax=Aphidius gifuensis TaxID=684658 RepID=UPI001CDD684F|nr:laccase-14-like isoform X2 [Aphidius gifuensis]